MAQGKDIRILTAIAQGVVDQHDGEHGFRDGHRPNPDTWIAFPAGAKNDRIAVEIDRSPWQMNAWRWLCGDRHHQRLAGGYAAEDSAGMIAQKTFGT